jgi:hypothetical protein
MLWHLGELLLKYTDTLAIRHHSKNPYLFTISFEIVEKLVLEGSLFLGAFLRSVFG